MILKKKTWLIVGVFLLLTVCASFVLAADFKVNKKAGSVTVSETESLSNLYTGGNVVLINSDISKDLLTGGRVVTVNGNIEDDVWAAGQSVIVNGNVGGSVRVAGQDIIITGEVKEDVFAAGGSVTITETASIDGDLFVGAGTVIVNGPVEGDIRFAGKDITINSKIGGKAQGKAGSILTLGSNAQIVGNLNYTSPKEVVIDKGGRILGEVDFTLKAPKVKKQNSFPGRNTIFGIFTLWFLIKIVSLMAAGIVLVYVFRKTTKKIIEKSLGSFWSNLGIGFIALIMTPVASVILLITVIGMWLSGMVFSAYIFVVTLASLLAKISFGSWLIKTIKKEKGYKVSWVSVVVGVLSLTILGFLPFIGGIVWLVFMLIGLGALYRAIFHRVMAR